MANPRNSKPTSKERGKTREEQARPVRAKLAEQAAPREAAHGAVISRRAADRLRAGHLWVYASDVVRLDAVTGEERLLAVADERGILLGTALYSPASQITLRLVSRKAIDDAAWMALLEARLRRAIARRKPMLDDSNDACRLCFSEADELPGLIVDKYGPLAIVQRLARGLLGDDVSRLLVRVLREEVAPAAIVERPDPRIREIEGLPAPGAEALWSAKKGAGLAVEFHLNGLVFHYDANAGQKTGAFLDQRMNYAAARDWAERLMKNIRSANGRGLDVCCYQGGFAMHLAEVCRSVTGIDASHASLEVAERNLAANRERLKAEVEWLQGDAFAILRDWSDGGERFDAIVLDPPAFAKTRRAVEGAMRGYKELNLRALRMASAGGLLVTCSCSHHVGWSDFEAAVASAATDAGRRVRVLERRGAATDHPVVLNLPETEYLKCLALEVE